MRLSDFENEEALDLLADIIEPASEIMKDQEIVDIFRSGKPVLLAVAKVLKNHKKSAIEIVAAMHREEPGKVRFNAITLANDVLEILNDPQIQQVFTSQSQNKENTSSGSAMENTEESGR